MTLYEELREVDADIRMLEEELLHPWSTADKAFLEEEIEKLYQYRHRLVLELKMDKPA